MKHRYLIALGSNRRHRRWGAPRRVLAAAVAAIAEAGIKIRAVSPVIETAPLGPSRRRYANGAVLAQTRLDPEALLAALKRIEARFGRRLGGQRWGARVLDCDLVLWSGGCWASRGLTVPHPGFRERDFVLGPAARIVPRWRDPLTGLTITQLRSRLTRSKALPKRSSA